MKKVLFTATVDSHILSFHLPFLKYFKDLGYEVHVGTNGDENIPFCDKKIKISFERSPFKINNIKAIGQLRKVMLEEKYDVVHTHTPMGSVVTRIAAVTSRKKYKTRVLYTAHGLHFYNGAPIINWLLFYPVEKILSKYTDTLILINQEDYNFCKSKFKQCKDIRYIPGVGISKEKFDLKLGNEERIKLRKKLGIKENDFVAIFVARLDKNKNQGMLINCVEQLIKENNDIHLLLVGPDEFDGYYQKIANDKGLSKNVHFLGYRKDIPQLMKISDLSLSSSLREGLPVNIMEAFSCGLPVISYNCRGSRDLISDGINGFVINNEQEMIKKIKIIMNDKKLYDKISRNNLLESKKYYSDSIVEMMKDIYNKKKKVLHLLASNKFSGAENVACTIINNMDKQYKMIYCCPNGQIENILKEKQIDYFPIKKLTLKQVKKVVNIFNPDIIHAHDNTATVIASFFGKKYSVISHIHGNNKIMNSLNIKTVLFNFSTRNVKRIIWVSDSSLNDYYFKKNIINKSVILYNIVNQNDIIKKSNLYDCNANYDLIYLGRLAYPKNPERLIEIIKELKKVKNDIKVAIVGDGADRVKVQESIHKYGLEKNIKMYGFKTNPYPILKNSKILIMTSIYEGTPMCALEAQALKKPIVATPVDGLKHIIINDKNGFLSDNNTELCDKILKLLNDNTLMQNMAKNVASEFIRYNNLNNYCKIIEECYEEKL